MTRPADTLPAPLVTVKKLQLDGITMRLVSIHEKLGELPLSGLGLKCDACGHEIEGKGSRLVVDSVIAIEEVIAMLSTLGQRAA